MQFISIMVVTSLLNCIAFAIVVLYFAWHGVEVSDTLIQMFFTVFGVEIGAAAAIQISKHRIKLAEKKSEVDSMKKEGLPVEKEDLKLEEKNDYEEGTYYG